MASKRQPKEAKEVKAKHHGCRVGRLLQEQHRHDQDHQREPAKDNSMGK
jgi:hypothetical protein